jgi:hypothetical protein
MMANPAYNGCSTPEEILKIFKIMLNYSSSLNGQTLQQQNTGMK